MTCVDLLERATLDDLDNILYLSLILLGRRGLIRPDDVMLLEELEIKFGLIVLPQAA